MSDAVPAHLRNVRTFVAAILVLSGSVLPGFLCAVLAVQLQTALQFGHVLLGLAIAAFYAAGSLASITGGRLVDRWGWSRGLMVAAGFTAISLVGIAALASHYAVLVAFLVVGGVGMAVAGPAASVAIGSEVPERRRGVVLGLNYSGIPLATMLAGASLPLIALTIGWRWAFVCALVCPLAASLARSRARNPRAPSPTAPAAPPPRRLEGLLTLTVAAASANIAVGALAGFAVVTVVDTGIAESSAGILVAVAGASALVVRISGGWLVDRAPRRVFPVAATMLGLGAVGFALLASRNPALVAPALLLAFGPGWGWQTALYYGILLRYPASAGRAIGYAQVGLAGGAAVGPPLIGVLIDQLGHATAWGVAAACCASATVLIAVMDRSMRGDSRHVPGIGKPPRKIPLT